MNAKDLTELFTSLGFPFVGAELASHLLALFALVAIAWCANWIAKRIIVRTINEVARRTPTKWDDHLVRFGVFTRMSHVAPALVVQFVGPRIFEGEDEVLRVASVAVSAYLVIIALLVIDALLNALLDALEVTSVAQRVPIKSFIQAFKLILFLVGFILLLSIIFDRNPLYFFSGLGALTAVLLLVFKDSILGLVAGIQLAANNMIQKGDWIEMPKHGADGDVVDVTLTTIKVQNWDRTITTVPTYSLISEAFKNWRGMSESGGRRIKRALHIDMQTVRFIDDEQVARLRRIELLRPYMDARIEEVRAWNEEHGVDQTEICNGRRLTNLGCFRAYITAYLRHHPTIHQDMTFLVRHLAPGPEGLPIELYIFTNDTRWAVYEGVQADIFDHLLAVVPEFGLRVFQSPSGGDVLALGRLLRGESVPVRP